MALSCGVALPVSGLHCRVEVLVGRGLSRGLFHCCAFYLEGCDIWYHCVEKPLCAGRSFLATFCPFCGGSGAERFGWHTAQQPDR